MRRTSARAPALRVRVESSPAYEFVLSLAVAASPATTPEAEALRDAAGPSLSARVRRFAVSDWMWAHLLSVAYDAPAPRDMPSLFAHAEAIDAVELQRRLVGFYVRWFRRLVPADVMEAAIRGRPPAVATFLDRTSREDPAWSASLRARLSDGAPRTKTELLAIVEDWNDRVFAHVVSPTLRRLARAANARRRSVAGVPAADAVRDLVGWDYVPEPGITRVLLIPSLVLRPAIHEFEHEQSKFVCFPVQPVTPQPRASGELMRISRALADESRLRIVAALGASDLTAQEIADRLDLSLNTVLHHLAELRAAGLVEEGGRRLPYRIARRGVARAVTVLRQVVGGVS